MNQETKQLEQVHILVKHAMPKDRPYHNYRHVIDVLASARKLAIIEKIPIKDKFLLETAALLHDLIYNISAKDNEERTALFAREYLPKIGYSKEQTQKIAQLILATKFPTNPKNYLAKILCDADVDNLGRKDFIKRGEELREELGIKKDKNWLKMQLALLQNHRFYTRTTQISRDKGKQENIARVESLLAAS